MAIHANVLISVLLFSAVAARATEEISVSPTRVGPLKMGMVIDAAVIRRLFPDCKIKISNWGSEGETLGPSFECYFGGKKTFVVYGTSGKKVHGVSVLSRKVAVPSGVRVGASYGDLEKRGAKIICRPGREELSGKTICYQEGIKAIKYIVVLGANLSQNISEGSVPELPLLRKGRIQEIVWGSLTSYWDDK